MPLTSPSFYFSTSHLSVGYNGNPVVNDITLSVNRGQILTIIGPNGSGKSTILKTLSGRLPPVSVNSAAESIHLDGQPLSSYPRKELARRIAVMSTDPVRTDNMTVKEIAEAGRYPYTGSLGLLSGIDHRITEEALKTAHAEELSKRDFNTLSDGQRQRVLLARALAQEPELLILDEPTSYLDIRHQLEFLDILKKLSEKQNTAVIMSLHELFLAERISDEIACIRNGRVDRIDTPVNIFSGSYIDELYDLPPGTYASLRRRS